MPIWHDSVPRSRGPSCRPSRMHRGEPWSSHTDRQRRRREQISPATAPRANLAGDGAATASSRDSGRSGDRAAALWTVWTAAKCQRRKNARPPTHPTAPDENANASSRRSRVGAGRDPHANRRESAVAGNAQALRRSACGCRRGGAPRTEGPRAGGAQRTEGPRAGGAQRTEGPRAGGARRTEGPRVGGAQRTEGPRVSDARRAEGGRVERPPCPARSHPRPCSRKARTHVGMTHPVTVREPDV